MSGPINGLGAQQQLPYATQFKPGQSQSGQNNGLRQPEENQNPQQAQNTVQPQGTQAAQSQATENGSQDVSQNLNENLLAQGLESSSSPTGEEERGSLLDITV